MGNNPWTYILLFIVIIVGGVFLLVWLFSLLMAWLGGRVADKTIDKYQKKAEGCLPGKNCGACGYESCAAYADAVLHAMCDDDLCPHGEADLSEKMEAVRKELQALMEDPTPPKEPRPRFWDKKH